MTMTLRDLRRGKSVEKADIPPSRPQLIQSPRLLYGRMGGFLRGPADPAHAFKSGAPVGGNKLSTEEGFLPVGLLGKGDEVANIVVPSFTGKRVERPPLSRGTPQLSPLRFGQARCNRAIEPLVIATRLQPLVITAFCIPVMSGLGGLLRLDNV